MQVVCLVMWSLLPSHTDTFSIKLQGVVRCSGGEAVARTETILGSLVSVKPVAQSALQNRI